MTASRWPWVMAGGEAMSVSASLAVVAFRGESSGDMGSQRKGKLVILEGHI
jgi:hypothetical protein